MRIVAWELLLAAVAWSTMSSTAACSNATWNDTFSGQGTRSASTSDASVPPDAASSITACQNLAASKAIAPITVTFPGYETGSAHIHVVTATGSCDLPADSTQAGLVFTTDALACAALLAPGTPSSAQATASGGGAPNDLTFQWGYGLTCSITDEYSLAKQ